MGKTMFCVALALYVFAQASVVNCGRALSQSHAHSGHNHGPAAAPHAHDASVEGRSAEAPAPHAHDHEAAPAPAPHAHHDDESHASHGGQTTTTASDFSNKRFLTDITSNLTGHRGVWFGLGDQYSQNVWSSFDNEQLPNCSARVGEMNWDHFAEDDPHYLTLAGSEDTMDYITAGHQMSGVSRVLNYTNSLLEFVNLENGVKSCKHWQPFVDLRTGELKAYSVGMYLWTMDPANASAPVNYTSLSCEAAGNEVVGCYDGEVDRTADVPDSVKAVAAQRKASGTFIDRPAGSIISVSTNTYVCKNGECLASAPKFAEEHDH